MKKRAVIVFIMSFILIASPTPAMAGKDPNRQTLWNSITDWFATVGKSEGEKIQIKKDRRDARRAERLEKARQKKMAQTHRKMKAQNEAIMKRIHKRKSIPNREENTDLR